MDRNLFFAELDQLTPSQIEARLPSWDREQLKLVEEYLERGTQTCPESCNRNQTATALSEEQERGRPVVAGG